MTVQKCPAFLNALDTSIYTILTALSQNDRISFLRVQRLIREHTGPYRYLEVGSEMGGSLVPHLVDPLCACAISIDARPASMPDERGTYFHYPDNSTEKMRETLRTNVGAEALNKLRTFDCDASQVPRNAFPKIHLGMIDGEHTNVACFSDFISLLALTEPDCIICFHDANLIADAILNSERMLEHSGIPFTSLFLPDCVGVIGLRGMADVVHAELGPHALDRKDFLARAREGRWYAIAESMLAAGQFQSLQNAAQRLSEVEQTLADLQSKLQETEAMLAAHRSSRAFTFAAALQRLAGKGRDRVRRLTS